MTVRMPAWRLAVLLFTFLAFAAQSYVTQTHIHFTSNVFADGFSVKADVKVTGKTTPRKNLPSNDDPANCPICQAVAHSGQFVTPSAIGFALPTEALAFIPLAIAAGAACETISHNWQSRAPPHH